MKNKIRENIATWSSYELDGNLVDTIAKLNGLMKGKPDHFDFTIEVESESGHYGSCSSNVIIDAIRWETDSEHENRLLAEKNKKKKLELAAIKAEETRLKRERSLYESLKKKFDKEIEEGSKKVEQRTQP